MVLLNHTHTGGPSVTRLRYFSSPFTWDQRAVMLLHHLLPGDLSLMPFIHACKAEGTVIHLSRPHLAAVSQVQEHCQHPHQEHAGRLHRGSLLLGHWLGTGLWERWAGRTVLNVKNYANISLEYIFSGCYATEIVQSNITYIGN